LRLGPFVFRGATFQSPTLLSKQVFLIEAHYTYLYVDIDPRLYLFTERKQSERNKKKINDIKYDRKPSKYAQIGYFYGRLAKRPLYDIYHYLTNSILFKRKIIYEMTFR